MLLSRKNEVSGLLPVNAAWKNFAEQLQSKVTQPAELAKWASKSLPKLHEQLSTNPQFQYKLALAKNKSLQRYSDSELLFSDSTMKVSLVAIDKGRPLPLHDHPGASGIMLVLDGTVNVCHCNAEPLRKGQSLSLNIVKLNTLKNGEVSWFTQNERNIHSVDAISQRALLLVVHTPEFSSQQQSYYFPLTSPLSAGAKIVVQRINAHVLSRISKQNTELKVLDKNTVS